MASCHGGKEDQALVDKYNEQQGKIELLEEELKKTRDEIEEIKTPESAPDLKGLQAKLGEVTERRELLEQEVSSLTVEKKKAEEALVKYRKTYPIR